MKRHAAALFGIATLLAAAPAPAQPGSSQPIPGIEWTTYDAGIRLARETGKPVFLEFWADWCPPCHEMDREVYTRPSLIQASRRFVCIRLDFDRERHLARRFKVFAIPAMIVVDPWSTVLASHVGYTSADRLLETMKVVPGSFEDAAPALGRLEVEPAHFRALMEAGKFYNRAGLDGVARQFYTRAGKTGEARDRSASDEVQLALGVTALKLKDSKEAERIFSKAAKTCDPVNEPFMLLGLARAYLQRNKTAEAQKTCEDLIARHPQTASAQKARELLATRQWDR